MSKAGYDLLFAEAELVDYRNDGRMVHSVREYSYSCEQISGPGWAAVGDAGGNPCSTRSAALSSSR